MMEKQSCEMPESNAQEIEIKEILMIGSISRLPAMNTLMQLPHKLPRWTVYVNFEPPSLPIYPYLRYFTLNLGLKIKFLRAPITQNPLFELHASVDI
jgi:hypothetical protein